MMTDTSLPSCFHCGLDIATGDQFSEVIEGECQLFCCPACKTIAGTILACGMQSFYQFRTRAEAAPTMDILSSSFSAFDDAQFQQRFVVEDLRENANPSATVNLLIGGIHCAACVWLLEKYLQQLPGIVRVNVSLSEQKATVHWQKDITKLSSICETIAQLGYQPEPYSADQLQNLQQQENRQALRRLGVAGIAMMQVGMFAIALYAGSMQSIALEYRDFMRWVSLLVATPVVLYSAKPFFVGAWRGLKMLKPGMDLPVAIAIGLAYLASVRATFTGSGEVYFDSVTMFTFLLLSGRYLEMRARHFSRRLSANDLNSLLPSTAIKWSADRQQSVPLFNVKKGDTVLVKPGQVIPADGLVVSGRSGVNESQLTGEFMPQTKTLGDRVVAGTLNGEGVLTIDVTATGAQLQLQTINTLLTQAQSEKPVVAQWADRMASVFIVSVLFLALSTYIYWSWQDSANAFWIMLSVLVVSCPCALSLATPATLVAATSRLRKMGMLVTSSQVWEKIPTITHVVCDKTGTLTEGRLAVQSVDLRSVLTPAQCLDIAAALEAYSEHPIASAFAQKKPPTVVVDSVRVVTGKGVEGVVDGVTYRIGSRAFTDALTDAIGAGETVKSIPSLGQWVFLSNQYGPVCQFELKDTVRDSAQSLVSSLHRSGLKVHMLSGDSSAYAKVLSDQLGMDHCVYGASPEDKLLYIRQLQAEGSKVMMLGDGINDIPVLAAADVSVAMCHASDLAKTHADCILLSKQLDTVASLIALTNKTRQTIKQNLSWALTYNLAAIPLAAMAMIAPYIAAVGMSISSLVVVINALKLQWVELDEKVPAIVSKKRAVQNSPLRVGEVR
jgi:P-type Cu2+ transporter